MSGELFEVWQPDSPEARIMPVQVPDRLWTDREWAKIAQGVPPVSNENKWWSLVRDDVPEFRWGGVPRIPTLDRRSARGRDGTGPRDPIRPPSGATYRPQTGAAGGAGPNGPAPGWRRRRFQRSWWCVLSPLVGDVPGAGETDQGSPGQRDLDTPRDAPEEPGYPRRGQ